MRPALRQQRAMKTRIECSQIGGRAIQPVLHQQLGGAQVPHNAWNDNPGLLHKGLCHQLVVAAFDGEIQLFL
ncbi:hypothetical protein D3C72_2318040 [compost metagenome]